MFDAGPAMTISGIRDLVFSATKRPVLRPANLRVGGL
jgi:hypothetical protein